MSQLKPAKADGVQDLPTPDQFPEADVVIYDGHCFFCKGQVARLHRLDGRNRLAFISLHDESVARRYPDLTHDQMMKQMYVIDRQGGRHGGANAIRYLSRRLPSLWLLAPLLHIPFTLPLWSWLYNQIAIRRYRMNPPANCENGACEIHFRK